MTTADLMQDFTAMLKRGEHKEAAAKFNADDIVSIEAMDGPMGRIAGKGEVEKKSEWWYANHEVHSAIAEGPFINGDQFGVLFAIDVTAKESGERMQLREIGLYTMKDGKIAEERFYFLRG